jgi:HEAT repeat protein
MKIELLCVIALLVCLMLIGVEYIIHYRLAERQDEHSVREQNMTRRMNNRVDAVLRAPTRACLQSEIKAMSEDIGDDHEAYETAIRVMSEIREKRGDEKIDKLIEEIKDEVNPVEIYAKMLEEGDDYHKGYALRKLADLGAEEYRDTMTELLSSKNRDLAYNAAMSLVQFGDVENVADYIMSIEDDRKYSGRIVNEFFDDFKGDRAKLAECLFERCNNYMKSTIIKAIVPYKIEEFRPMYIEGLAGKDFGMKVACIKAIAAFGNPEDEQLLQIAAKDKEWVIRASAVRGLSLLNTKSALKSVKVALTDKEWWVRQTAAKAITEMDISPRDLEDILGGYDRFAADAVKAVLYKKVDSLA